MGKQTLSDLEIVEVGTPIDPCDSQALAHEAEKLRLLISLILKAHERDTRDEQAHMDRANRNIRRKVGLAA